MADQTIHEIKDGLDGYRSSDDEDYVPDVKDDVVLIQKIDDDAVQAMEEKTSRVRQEKSDALWKDLQQNLPSSKKAEKILKQLQGKTTQKKKKKIIEFKMPTLGIDVYKKKSISKQSQQVVQKVKFAGEEYHIPSIYKKDSSSTNTSALDSMVHAATTDVKNISTIEKTSLDWDTYKKKEGIEDELKQHVKDGYLEKQDFLTRVDHRKFALEKTERDKKRKK